MKMFSIDEVLFFQAQDKYTRVVTADSEGHIRTPLKELLAALDSEIVLAGASQRDRAGRRDPRRREERGRQTAPHHPRPPGNAARQQRVSVPLPRNVEKRGLPPYYIMAIGRPGDPVAPFSRSGVNTNMKR